MSSAAAASSSKIESHVWQIAAVVVLGTIMSVLDTTIVNVALDTLGRELHTTLAQIQWVATGYLLSLAAAALLIHITSLGVAEKSFGT